MPRRKRVFKKHEIRCDEKFNSILISKLINNFMIKGKKNTAKKIVYSALEVVGEITGKKSVDVFATAIKNVTPLLEIKTRRIGAVNYQVPIEISHDRGINIALKFIVKASRDKNVKKLNKLPPVKKIKLNKYSLINSLATVIIDSANNTGKAVEFKETQHKIAESNKANARYRW